VVEELIAKILFQVDVAGQQQSSELLRKLGLGVRKTGASPVSRNSVDGCIVAVLGSAEWLFLPVIRALTGLEAVHQLEEDKCVVKQK